MMPPGCEGGRSKGMRSASQGQMLGSGRAASSQAGSMPNTPSPGAPGWLDWTSKNVPASSIIFLDTVGATKAGTLKSENAPKS